MQPQQQQQAPAASAPYGHHPAHMHHPHVPSHHPPSAAAPAGPNPELLPGPERAYYDHLFQEALGGQQLAHGGHGHAAFLHGPAAVAFLSRSGLDKPALRSIWALCDPQGHGFLARPQFHLAMRLVAMAQAGFIDPMDPTLPGRIQARDPLSVALPQLPPVRLAPAHEASAAVGPTLSPPMQPVVAPSAAALPQQQPQAQDDGGEEEDEFGDFESASTSPPLVEAAPAPIPSMPTPTPPPLEPQPQQPPMAAVTVQAAADEEVDDFGEFNAAEAGVESSVGIVVATNSTTSIPGAPTTFEAVAVSASTTAAAMATMSPTGGTTGLAILSSSQSISAVTTSSSSSSSSSSSLPTPAMAMAPAADIGARMAAFDAIVEESDWGDFEEADAPAAAPVASAAPQAASTPPLAFTAGGLIAQADMLMGLAGEEKEGTVQPPALPFGGIVSTGGAGGGGGGLLDLDLLALPSTAATADPFAMAAPVASSAPPSFGAPAPGLDVLGGSTGGGGAVMSQLMTETPPSSPKAVQPHEYRSPSPPLPSIHNLDLDPSRAAAGGNPFASAAATAAAVGRPFSSSSPGPFADTGAGGLRMGSDGGGGGSLVGLAGAGIGTGSIYEQSPYADPDAAVPQGPSPLLGAASPPLVVGGGGGGVPKAAEEKEDALTSAFKAVDAMTSAGFAAGLGDNNSSGTSGSPTGLFSSPPSSVPPLPFFAPAPSAAPAMGSDLFGFSGEEGFTAAPAAPAPVFGGSSGADEWGAFNGGGISALSTAPAPTLVSAPLALALAPAPAPAPASDDPFAGLQRDEEEETAMAAGAIQHEEVSPSSRGSSSPDRPMGSKGVEAAVPAAATAVQEEEDDEWGAFSTAKEEASVPAPTPIVPTATTTTSPLEPADPWSHPDPWGAVVSPPVATGAVAGGSGAAAASASASSILLDPLHVAPPVEPATAHEDEEEEGALAAVLPRLWAKGLLGAAAALTEHLEAGRALPGVAVACEVAKREDQLEEALALKRRMCELEGRVAGAGQLAAWRALGAGEDATVGHEEGGDVLLERLRRQVEAGAGPERAVAFAGAFIAGQPSLAAQAQDGDARGALRRARRARRCAALIVGMAAAAALVASGPGEQGVGGGGGGGPLAAYPRHWERTLATAAGKLGEAAAFCRRVAALPSAETRREVGASLKVWTFVEASLEILRVARFVRASAGDALLELRGEEEEEVHQGVEALAEALQTALGEMGLEAAVAAGWPLGVEAVRDAVADCGGEDEEEEAAAAPAVDPRSVCNLCLLPLAAARKLGGGAAHAPVPVTYFSGAAYHSACCNLWLNAISLETPQPVTLAGSAGVGLMGMAGGLSGDAMDGSTSSGRVSVESGSGSNGGGTAADGAALGPAALAEGKALEAKVPF